MRKTNSSAINKPRSIMGVDMRSIGGAISISLMVFLLQGSMGGGLESLVMFFGLCYANYLSRRKDYRRPEVWLKNRTLKPLYDPCKRERFEVRGLD